MPPPSPPIPPSGNEPDPRRSGDTEADIRAAEIIFRGANDKGGGPQHPRVRDYLRARGIDAAKLPAGRLPDCLLFSPQCRDKWDSTTKTFQCWPAMVARCVTPLDAVNRVTLVHRTFLDPGGEPRKRDETDDLGPARKHRGVRNGHTIRLYPSECPVNASGVAWPRWRGPFPRGVLVLGEGIETVLAVVAATGVCGWSCLDTHGLKTVVLPEEILTPFFPDGTLKREGEWVHTIIIAADLDRSRGGQSAASIVWEILSERHRRQAVRIAWPTPNVTAGLTEPAKAGELRECHRCQGTGRNKFTNSSCSTCDGDGRLGFREGEVRPKLGADGQPIKGVDWNDVLVAPGAGAEMVVTGIFQAICHKDLDAEASLAANMRRAIDWKPDPVKAPTGDVPAAGPQAASAASGGSGGGAGGRNASRAGGTAPGAGSSSQGGTAVSGGGGIAGGDAGWGPPGFGGLVRFYEGFPGPVISPGPLERARAFLLMECSPPEGSRRFRLLRWAMKWWWFDDVGWRPLGDEQLFGLVQHWLNSFSHLKRMKTATLPEIVPLHPHKRMVLDVVESLKSETFADVAELPAWLPPSINELGEPLFGGSVRTWDYERIARAERAESRAAERGEARDYIAFQNGLLDRRALVRDRKVRMVPLTADLFTQAACPYDLPISDLQAALDRGPGGVGLTDELCYRLMPCFTRGLAGAVGDSRSDEERQGRKRDLGYMLADTIGLDRSIEKIFLVLGPQRSFKGCMEEAVMAMVGRHSVAMTSFYELGGDRFGIAPLVGRSTGIMSDAHVGQMMDGTRAVELLKIMSGGGSVAVRDMHQIANPNVRINMRFWIFANDEPDKLKDNSGAFAGRFVVWPTTVSFFGKEDPTVKVGIKNEGPGLAVMALYYHAELFAMARPAIGMGELGRTIAEEIADSGSNVLAFLKACVVCPDGADRPVYDDDASVIYRQLYEVYVRYCTAKGWRPVGDNKLVSRIRPLVPGIKGLSQPRGENDERKRVLPGIALRTDLPAEYLLGEVGADPEQHRKPKINQYTDRDEPPLDYSNDIPV